MHWCSNVAELREFHGAGATRTRGGLWTLRGQSTNAGPEYVRALWRGTREGTTRPIRPEAGLSSGYDAGPGYYEPSDKSVENQGPAEVAGSPARGAGMVNLHDHVGEEGPTMVISAIAGS